MNKFALPVLLLIELVIFIPQSGMSVADYLTHVATTSAPLLILAAGMTVVLMTSGIDLSVGAMVAVVACVISAVEPDRAFWILAVPLGLVLAVVLGAFNGLLVARLDVPPIVATLGTLFFYRGLCQAAMGSLENTSTVPVWMGDFPGAPLIALGVIALGAGYLYRSRWQREILMLGGNRVAARYAAIPVHRRLFEVYTLMGLVSFLAALCALAHDGSVKASSYAGWELKVIVAVVLGGTPVSGGRGSIIGSALGVLLIAVLEAGLISQSRSDWLLFLLGPLLVLGVWLNMHAQRTTKYATSR